MLEPIEELFRKEVTPFTNGILKLHNKSRPILYKTENEFLDAYTKNGYVQNEDYVSRGFMDKSSVMHLNPSDPEWHTPIMAFFQPEAFFLERSELGQSLAKNGVAMDVYNDDRYFFLGGIGMWVEIRAIERMNNSDRKLNDLKKELVEEVKSMPFYQAFQMCDYFWDAAHKADLSSLRGTKEPEPSEIIAAGILGASRLAMTEKDLYGNFNSAFSKLGDIAFRTKGKSIVDLYHIGGMYKKKEKIIIPPEEIEDLEDIAEHLGHLITINRQIGQIVPAMEKVKEKISQISSYGKNPFTGFVEVSSTIHKGISTAANVDSTKTLDQIDIENSTLKKLSTEFLISLSNEIELYKKELYESEMSR